MKALQPLDDREIFQPKLIRNGQQKTAKLTKKGKKTKDFQRSSPAVSTSSFVGTDMVRTSSHECSDFDEIPLLEELPSYSSDDSFFSCHSDQDSPIFTSIPDSCEIPASSEISDSFEFPDSSDLPLPQELWKRRRIEKELEHVQLFLPPAMFQDCIE